MPLQQPMHSNKSPAADARVASPLIITPCPAVQVASLHCVAGFIQQLEEAKERDAFQPMIGAMLATLGRCLQVRSCVHWELIAASGSLRSADGSLTPRHCSSTACNLLTRWNPLTHLHTNTTRKHQASDEQSAQEVLEQLIEVAEQHPKFLKKQLGEVISAMLQIANADSLDPPTRTLAVEFMVTLCEARDRAPGMVSVLGAAVGMRAVC